MNLSEILRKCEQHQLEVDERIYLKKVCRFIALAYLRMKNRSAIMQLVPDNDLEQVVEKVLGNLFEVNQDGEFHELNDYIANVDLNNSSEPELTIELRKYVFSKVDDLLYQDLQRKNPALQTTIDRLEQVIGNYPKDESITYQKGVLVVDGTVKTHLPQMSSELMRVRLGVRLNGDRPEEHIIKEVIRILREQSSYQKSFNVPVLAWLITEHFS